jgi:hypothetical protein
VPDVPTTNLFGWKKTAAYLDALTRGIRSAGEDSGRRLTQGWPLRLSPDSELRTPRLGATAAPGCPSPLIIAADHPMLPADAICHLTTPKQTGCQKQPQNPSRLEQVRNAFRGLCTSSLNTGRCQIIWPHWAGAHLQVCVFNTFCQVRRP